MDWYTAARLWSKIKIPDVPRHRDMCWEFDGHRDRFGYGRLKVGDRPVFAHRLALEHATGEGGKLACHRCHNPACCNPEHLYWGDEKSNAEDRVRRFTGGKSEERRLMKAKSYRPKSMKERLKEAIALPSKNPVTKGETG